MGACKYKVLWCGRPLNRQPIKGAQLSRLLSGEEKPSPELQKLIDENSKHAAIVNIESLEAIANLDAILDVPGLDAVLGESFICVC